MNGSKLILLAAALACGLAAVSAQQMPNTTTGLYYKGFTYGSNVLGYTYMSVDACDMKAAISGGNASAALDIYLLGKNSNTSATSKRRYQSWATAAHPSEPTYNMLLSYHSPSANSSWLDDKIQAAFAEGRTARAYSLINTVVDFKYMMHEVDAAMLRTIAGNATNITTGAPHNLDEAWAIYSGSNPAGCDTIMMLADSLASELGLSYFSRSPVNLAYTAAFNDVYAASRSGDAAAFQEARERMLAQLAVYHAQGLFRYAYAYASAVTCKNAKLAANSKDVALSYWDVLAPLLQSRGTSTSALAKVASAVTASKPTVAAVKSALSAALTAAKLPGEAVLGKPSFNKINTDPKCKAGPKKMMM